MIAIDTNFAVARYPIPLRSRLRRRNTDFQPVCRSSHNISYFFPATTGAGHFALPGRDTKHQRAILLKSICFQIQALPGTHVLREAVSMACLIDTQLGIMIFLSRHSNEESVKFRHK